MQITALTNKDRTGFFIPSEYNKQTLKQWLKEYDAFEITPKEKESKSGRGYLEGAVVQAYCHWQYDIDPRAKGMSEARRFLFKRDFNYEIQKNRKGDPVRTPVSSKGKVKEITDIYTQWAEQNGAPIPNPALYKLWRDKWSMDARFPEFHDFLVFLNLECDAMPSSQTLEKLREQTDPVDYPKETNEIDKCPF